MMSPGETTPTTGTGKNGKAKPSAKKVSKRSRKTAQQDSAPQEPAQQAPEAEQVEQSQEPVTIAMEHPFVETVRDAPAAATPSEPTEAAPAEHAEATPVSLQTITDAYGDFTRKSIEQTGSFFEQLAGVRSFNRVFELQGEFARQSYETFVSESRKIRELHSELTVQRLRDLEGLVARMKSTRSS